MARTHLARPLLVAPIAGLVAAVAVAAPAGAHTGHPVTSAGSGLLHPITGLDHLLAMVAVGVVAAVAVERGRRWMVPAAFVGGMALGGVAGMVGIPFPGAELMIVASVVLLGLAVLASVELPSRFLPVALGLLAVAGAAHGHAHGAEAPLAANEAAYVVGFLAATVSLHLAGVGIGAVIRDRRTVRLATGLSAVAAGALLLFA